MVAPFAFWANHTIVCKLTGYSPFYMVHSVEPTLPFNILEATFLVPGLTQLLLTQDLLAHSPSVCLQDLLENNPSLRPLKVTQLPSWVRAPRLFQPGSSSSLVFAFEDPDSTIAPSLIAARHLFCFRARITVRRWQQPPPSHQSRVPAQSYTKPPGPSAMAIVAAVRTLNLAAGPPGPEPELPGASSQKHDLSPKTPPSAKGTLARKKAWFAAGA